VALPTDGFGIYENIHSSLGQSVWGPRLTQIAQGGFRVVINYGLLFGHIADVTAYINYAAGLGLKVAVTIQDPVIWKTGTYGASYTSLYSDAGSPGTGTAFMQYVVAQTSALSGVWGWYIGDEVANADHSTFATYAAAVATADATHPRLIIEQGGSSSACANSTSIFNDSCDVIGDDYYPIGNAAAYTLTTATTASGIQTYCSNHNLGSAIVLQAFSWTATKPGAPWPTEAQMQQARLDAISNMTPRLVLFFAYPNIIDTGSPDFAPALEWIYLTEAVTGRSQTVLFPTATRRGSTPSVSYVSTVLANSPFAYYRMNEQGYNLAKDSSGNGYNGTYTNGYTLKQPGPVLVPADTSVLLDGSTGYIALPSGLNTDGLAAFTLETWFNLSQITYNYFPMIICNDSSPTSSHVGFSLSISPAANKAGGFFLLGNGSTAVSLNFYPGVAFAANTWYHLCCTYDGATVSAYVNGVVSAVGSLTGTIGTATHHLFIGVTTSLSSHFPGYLGQLALYSTALSAAQVINDYRTALETVRSTTIQFPTAYRRQS